MREKLPEAPCSCSGPGYCERYRLQQGVYTYGLCSGQGSPGKPCTPDESQRRREIWASRLARDAAVELPPPDSIGTRPEPRGVDEKGTSSNPTFPAPIPRPVRIPTPHSKSVVISRPSPQKTDGPGKQLKILLEALGLRPSSCNCDERAAQMNNWGVEGCKENYGVILSWLREEQGKLKWLERAGAVARAIASGIAFSLDPADPAKGILDEAIRRAEVRERGRAEGNV